MSKIANMRERVHQPFRDSLVRTSGFNPGTVQQRGTLFTQTGKNDAESNLKTGAQLPNDQSIVVLALRVLLLFLQPRARTLAGGAGTNVTSNGDYLPAGYTANLN